MRFEFLEGIQKDVILKKNTRGEILHEEIMGVKIHIHLDWVSDKFVYTSVYKFVYTRSSK